MQPDFVDSVDHSHLAKSEQTSESVLIAGLENFMVEFQQIQGENKIVPGGGQSYTRPKQKVKGQSTAKSANTNAVDRADKTLKGAGFSMISASDDTVGLTGAQEKLLIIQEMIGK
jgi:hypothetical protein